MREKKKKVTKWSRPDFSQGYRWAQGQEYKLAIYDQMRTFRSQIKEIMWRPEWNYMLEEDKNAIEALHSVLYLAEGQMVDFDKPTLYYGHEQN